MSSVGFTESVASEAEAALCFMVPDLVVPDFDVVRVLAFVARSCVSVSVGLPTRITTAILNYYPYPYAYPYGY
jgi:hypothetical protein